jgi:hypothetical protein
MTVALWGPSFPWSFADKSAAARAARVNGAGAPADMLTHPDFGQQPRMAPGGASQGEWTK